MKLFSKIKNWVWEIKKNDRARSMVKTSIVVIIFFILTSPTIIISKADPKNSITLLMGLYVILVFSVLWRIFLY